MANPSKKTMDARFAEKLKARAEGRTAVLVTENIGSDPLSRDALNARFREKIKARAEAAKKAAAAAKTVDPTDEAAKGKKAAAAAKTSG